MRVNFRCGAHETAGHLAVAAGGRGPGVLVFQEWWGLVPQIERVCDRLAAEGFTALAPDMYSGRSTTNPDEAGKLMMALDVPSVAADTGGALDFLLAHPACSSKRAGVMGYCLGGQLALFAACSFPSKVGACADYYGVHPAIRPDLARLDAPVLGLFAEKDAYVNTEVVAHLSAALTKAGKAHEFHTYPGVNHAFANETRPEVYDAPAAEDAWRRTLALFRAGLR